MKIVIPSRQQRGSATTRVLLVIIASLLVIDVGFRDSSVFKAISPPKQPAPPHSSQSSSPSPGYDAAKFHTAPNQPFVPQGNAPAAGATVNPLARPSKPSTSTPRQMTQVTIIDSGTNVDASSLHSGNRPGATQAQLPQKKGNQTQFPGMNWGPPLPVAIPGQQFTPASQTTISGPK